MQRKDWTIRFRYFIEGMGWNVEDESFHGTLTEAHYAASDIARKLDAEYGDSHFWTVNIFNPAGPDIWSELQLFHGRLI